MALDFETEWLREDEFLSPLEGAFDAIDTPAIFSGLGYSIFLKS